MKRRTLLQLAAAGSAGLMGAVAGCSSGNGGNGDNGGSGSGTTAGSGGATTAGGQTTTGGGTGPGTATTSGATPGGATTATTTGGGTTSPTISVVSHPELGNILVGPNGMTLYLFTQDSAGESVCYGDCASAWPPLLVEGEPTAGSGVTADLGTITRRNGSIQVTVDGQPLYYYTPDQQPGDVTGQGVGGVWFVVAPDGSRITSSGTATGSETTTGTGSGGSTGSTGGINY